MAVANIHAFCTKRYIYIYMEKKEMAGARIYTIIGLLIFAWLAYTMFMNNYRYIKMDHAKLCVEQGGEWRAFSQECIFEEQSKESE